MGWIASPAGLPLAGLGVMAAVMTLLHLHARRSGKAAVVDVAWAYGVGALGVAYAALGTGDGGRRLALGIAAGLWSLRLGTHLLVDRILGKPEDGRYAELKRRWGDRADRNMFLFFLAQAGFAVIFSLPFLPVAFNGRPFPSTWDVVGVGIWLVAIAGEATADGQLARWRKDPANRGRTCRAGLWRCSRHPNYFFEWLHWFTYPALAVGSPTAWLAWMAPVVVLAFLFRFTGIPHTEAQALKTRGEDYRRYQAATSVFVPWFPRKEENG